MNVSGTRLSLYPDSAMMGDAAISKGMAGSGKYCGIFELPQACGGKNGSKLFLWVFFFKVCPPLRERQINRNH